MRNGAAHNNIVITIIGRGKTMDNDKSPSNAPKRTHRTLLYVLLAVVVLLISGLLLLPSLISSKPGQQIVLSQINERVPGKADFTDFSVGWRKGVYVRDFTFESDDNDILVNVEEVKADVYYSSLLAGNLSFGRTVILKPTVLLKVVEAPPPVPVVVPPDVNAKGNDGIFNMPIRRIDLFVKDGDVSFQQNEKLVSRAGNIDSEVHIRPAGSESNFSLAANISGSDRQTSTVNSKATITPGGKGRRWDLSRASGEFTVDVNGVDMETMKPFLAMAGIDAEMGGVVDGQIESSISQGKVENVNGNFTGSGIRFGGPILKGDVFSTEQLSIDIGLGRTEDLIDVERLELRGDWFSANAAGTVPMTLESLEEFIGSEQATLSADFEADAAVLASQLPNTLGLGEEVKITAGRISGGAEKVYEAGVGRLEGRTEISDLRGVVNEREVVLAEPIEARGRISAVEDVISYDEISVRSAFADVFASGPFDSLDYSADVDLAAMQEQFGQFIWADELDLAGKFSAAGKAGIGQIITLDGDLQVQDLAVRIGQRSAEEPDITGRHQISIDTEQQLARLDSFLLEGQFGQINVDNAKVPFDMDTGDLDLSVDTRVDIGQAKQWVELFELWPDDMDIDGVIDSRLAVSSANGDVRIVTDDSFVEDMRVAAAEGRPVVEQRVDIKFEGLFKPETGDYDVSWDIAGQQISTRGRIFSEVEDDTISMEGQTDLSYDWDMVAGLAGPYWPEGLTVAGRREDSYSFSSIYPVDVEGALLSNFSTTGRVGFDSAVYMGLEAGPTDIPIDFSEGVMRIEPFETTVNEGTLRLGCVADFRESPAIVRLTEPMRVAENIAINERVTSELLQYVNPIFARTVRADGRANFQCDDLVFPLDMEYFDQAVLDGTFSVEQMRLGASGLLQLIFTAIGDPGQRVMQLHPTRFMLENGRVRYDDMQIDVGRNPVNFGGSVDVLAGTLDMDVVLPYTTRGQTARVDQPYEGTRITIPLKGTIDDPDIDVAGAIGRGVIEDTLRRGLERLF